MRTNVDCGFWAGKLSTVDGDEVGVTGTAVLRYCVRHDTSERRW